jgi:hypothetical protein
MPNLMEMRWPAVLVSLVVSLGLLFGGYRLVQHQTVEAPMDVALRAISGLQTYTWQSGAARRLQLELKPGARLGDTYAAVAAVLENLEPGSRIAIDIKDTRTPELQALYDQVHLAVQEAIQTGHYTDMAARVDALAKQAHATATVTMDAQHVFVSLAQGDNHWLHAVVARPPSVADVLLQGVNHNDW